MKEAKETRSLSEIFGDYRDMDDAYGHEYLTINFSPSTLPIHNRWRSNGLSADFLADYCSTFFPADNTDSVRRQAEIKNIVAYIANELLENSMKFTYNPSRHAIGLKLVLLSDACCFYATNCANSDAIESFQAYLRELLAADPGDLYLRQLEMNAHAENSDVSRLGFLTMLCDYQARLGWKFTLREDEPNVVQVTTMVRLTV